MTTYHSLKKDRVHAKPLTQLYPKAAPIEIKKEQICINIEYWTECKKIQRLEYGHYDQCSGSMMCLWNSNT